MPEGATALLDGIIKAAEYLKYPDGRRVIVIMSDGVDTISDSTFEQAMKAAQLYNCQIYVVKTTDFENYKRTGQRGGNANIRSLEAERRMQEFTAQTGGRSLFAARRTRTRPRLRRKSPPNFRSSIF